MVVLVNNKRDIMAKYPLGDMINERADGKKEQNVYDKNTNEKLNKIEETQKQILEKLNGTLDTQVTGSKVEYVRESTVAKPSGKESDTLFLWDTGEVFLHDGTEWRVI